MHRHQCPPEARPAQSDAGGRPTPGSPPRVLPAGASGRARRSAPARPGQSGTTTIEAALCLGVVVIAFVGLMEIVGAAFESDRMERAAQAAARAIALDPRNPDPGGVGCAAIRGELRLPASFDCRAEWPDLAIDLDVQPDELPATGLMDSGGALTRVTSNTGDLVLVRIPWVRNPFSFEGADRIEPVTLVAMGLARNEP